MRRFSILLGVAALTVAITRSAPAQQTAPATKPDTAAVRAGLNDLTAKMKTAYLAGDAAAVAALYTEDARAEFAGFPSAVGRAAIQSTTEAYFKANKLNVAEWTIGGLNSLTADLATAGGTYHAFGNGKPAHAWWRWAAAYRKGADGQYRVSYVMAFPDSTK
jgi:ketosteroid isomerase-like protein